MSMVDSPEESEGKLKELYAAIQAVQLEAGLDKEMTAELDALFNSKTPPESVANSEENSETYHENLAISESLPLIVSSEGLPKPCCGRKNNSACKCQVMVTLKVENEEKFEDYVKQEKEADYDLGLKISREIRRFDKTAEEKIKSDLGGCCEFSFKHETNTSSELNQRIENLKSAMNIRTPKNKIRKGRHGSCKKGVPAQNLDENRNTLPTQCYRKEITCKCKKSSPCTENCIRFQSYSNQAATNYKLSDDSETVETIEQECDNCGCKRVFVAEMQVGSYGDLNKKGHAGDDLTPHHMPSDSYMKRNTKLSKVAKESTPASLKKGKLYSDYETADGICIMLQENRHRLTFTYGTMDVKKRGPYYLDSPTGAVNQDIVDVRGIMSRFGRITESQLKAVYIANVNKFPEMFLSTQKEWEAFRNTNDFTNTCKNNPKCSSNLQTEELCSDCKTWAK